MTDNALMSMYAADARSRPAGAGQFAEPMLGWDTRTEAGARREAWGAGRFANSQLLDNRMTQELHLADLMQEAGYVPGDRESSNVIDVRPNALMGRTFGLRSTQDLTPQPRNSLTDPIIEILRRYGLAGLMAGGAASQSVPQQD